MSAAHERGELALVLHSHMPYVEGFGTWPFGEEWLFEAMAVSYLPLMELCERWAERGRESVLTIGVTPVLADQLALPAVGERFLRFVREVRGECHRRDIRSLGQAGDAGGAEALRRSSLDYERAAERFERLGRDPLDRLRQVRDLKVVELWTSAATHALLPLLATEAGVRLQVRTGIDSHRERFGAWSGGFWLPECAFRPGLDEQLAVAGARAFCVYVPDGDDLPPEPVATPSGALAAALDWPTIALVWDERGYPADPVYRDYHSLTRRGLRARASSGAPYRAEVALERARAHAMDFVTRVGERLDSSRRARGRAGLVVCALDTELLGHWWYEGLAWLEAVVEECDGAGIALATLPEALERREPARREIAESSWGEGKDLATWDSPAVADLAWAARRSELRLLRALAESGENEDGRTALERAARELLALQSSDWAFMATRALAGDYPRARVLGHVAALESALGAGRPGMTDSRPMLEPETEADPSLGGLAPGLRLQTLLEPASAWGRSPAVGVAR